jgi:hypothetical protein
MNGSRRGSAASQTAGNGLFGSALVAETSLSQPGRRDTQHSGIQPPQERSSSRHASIRKSGAGSRAPSVSGLLFQLTSPRQGCCLAAAGWPASSIHCQHAGRYSSVPHGHRTSRSSVSRGSARGLRSGHIDSSGLPFQRIVCIDAEDGRDRTPKPLLAARRYGEHLSGWGGDALWGGGDGGGDTAAAAATASGAHSGGGFPSNRSWLGSETSEAALDALPQGTRPQGRESITHGGGRASMLHSGRASLVGGRDSVLRGLAIPSSAGSSVRGSIAYPSDARGPPQREGSGWGQLGESPTEPQLAADLIYTLLHQERLPQPQQGAQQATGRQRQRPKATQCAAAATASRGVQVRALELRSAAGGGPPPDAGVEGHPQAVSAPQQDQFAADADPEEEEAALLALQQTGAALAYGGGKGGRGGSRAVSLRGSTIHSQSSSRRGSMAGVGVCLGGGWAGRGGGAGKRQAFRTCWL